MQSDCVCITSDENLKSESRHPRFSSVFLKSYAYAYHSTIGKTPFEALFNRKPSFGLSDLGIPSELASEIHDEADLVKVIDEINPPDRSNMQSNSTNIISIETVPDFDLTPVNEVELPFHPQCIQDTYIDDISQPLPEGIRVFSSIPSSSTTVHPR